MTTQRNLLVTLADEKYLDFAKQLFSSVYFNSGWNHEVPKNNLGTKNNHSQTSKPLKKASSIIISHKSAIGKFCRWKKNHTQHPMNIIATDSITSYFLNNKNISHINAQQVIGRGKKLIILQQAANTVIQAYDNLTEKPGNNLAKKIGLTTLISIIIERYHILYVNELLHHIELQNRLHLFRGNDDLIAGLIERTAKSQARPYTIHKTSLFTGLQNNVKEYIFSVSENKLKHSWIGQAPWIKLFMPNRVISTPSQDIIIGPFSFTTNINEYLPAIRELHRIGFFVKVVIFSNVSSQQCRAITAAGGSIEKLDLDLPDLKYSAEDLTSDHLISESNRNNKLYFRLCEQAAQAIFSKPPQLFIFIDQQNPINIAIINQAKFLNIKTLTTLTTNDQLFLKNLPISFPSVNKPRFPALSNIAVINEQVVVAYKKIIGQYPATSFHYTGSPYYNNWRGKIKSFDRQAILEQFSLPPNARVILMTTQHYSYFIDYVRIAINTFSKLNQKNFQSPWYLIIRPHPLEHIWQYRIFTGRLPVNVILSKKATSYDLISVADTLVTSHSLTGHEAITLGCPILLLDFYTQLFRPHPVDHPLVHLVETVASFQDELRKLIESADQSPLRVNQSTEQIKLGLNYNSIEQFIELTLKLV